MRRFVVALLAPVLVVVAAGCGSSSNSSSTKSSSTPAAAPTTTAAATPAAGSNAIAVGETEFKLTPADPSVKSGKVTIVAKNNGKVTHAIAVEGAGAGGKDVEEREHLPRAVGHAHRQPQAREDVHLVLPDRWPQGSRDEGNDQGRRLERVGECSADDHIQQQLGQLLERVVRRHLERLLGRQRVRLLRLRFGLRHAGTALLASRACRAPRP